MDDSVQRCTRNPLLIRMIMSTRTRHDMRKWPSAIMLVRQASATTHQSDKTVSDTEYRSVNLEKVIRFTNLLTCNDLAAAATG